VNDQKSKSRHLVLKIFFSLSILAGLSFSATAGTAQFESCYARWNEHELVLGNAHFERHWRIDNGLLTATSFRNLDTSTEWIRQPAKSPAPQPANLHREPRDVSVATRTGRLGVTEEKSLEVIVTAKGSQSLVYRFRIFPGAGGVETFFDASTDSNTKTPAAITPTGGVTGIETGMDSQGSKDQPLADDALENLFLSPTHLLLTQATFHDQTDAHNELMQENEWMLLNEQNLQLTGNVFSVENPVTGEGLVFVKKAPLPQSRPLPTLCDCQVNARARQIRFAGQGYTYALLAYSGGSAGRVCALQTYQRQLRIYEPKRDGMFLSNTWGDRSKDGRISEKFVLQEIEAGARLGVDVVQIDDGWQEGMTGNSAFGKGAWGKFYAADTNFWQPHPTRFPNGFKPIVEAARSNNMKIGLWFAPDSEDENVNWQRDANLVLNNFHKYGVAYVKIDAVAIPTSKAEANLQQFYAQVLQETDGQVTFDPDATAGLRPSFFGTPNVGPIFVENRYTDWPNYWPHLTLRNLWKLSHYIDPLRLRMEFLNNARNTEKYGADPLAPGRYTPDALFATVMFANPLGWFEVSNLPTNYLASVSKLVKLWKAHREEIFSGHTIPVGTAPDGISWTGFVSASQDQKSANVLVFRELNPSADWSLEVPLLSGTNHRVTVLAGKGAATITGSSLKVQIPETLQYLWLKVE